MQRFLPRYLRINPAPMAVYEKPLAGADSEATPKLICAGLKPDAEENNTHTMRWPSAVSNSFQDALNFPTPAAVSDPMEKRYFLAISLEKPPAKTTIRRNN
jgi:hypothetical protein